VRPSARPSALSLNLSLTLSLTHSLTHTLSLTLSLPFSLAILEGGGAREPHSRMPDASFQILLQRLTNQQSRYGVVALVNN